MDLETSYRIVSMLASRSFHDMAGPASAVQNGLSFLDDPELFDTAKKHLEESALSLNTRLEFFRMLMGRRAAKDVGWDSVRRTSNAYWISNGLVALNWSAGLGPNRTDDTASFVRAVLCLQIALADMSPLGGIMTVTEFGDRNIRMTLEARRIDEDGLVMKVLLGEGDLKVDLTPKTAPAAWVQHFVASFGGRLTVDTKVSSSDESNGNDSVVVALTR